MTVLRRSEGFMRFALSVQYHGASFLGVPYLPGQEDQILPDGTDLRGYRSVEGRLREGLERLFPSDTTTSLWENIQVSSRTDRGVHALKNTLHVDIYNPDGSETENVLARLRKGLNYYLSRQTTSRNDQQGEKLSRRQRKRQYASPYKFLGEDWCRYSNDEIRILNAEVAPDFMVNKYAEQYSQPATIDWNARFSATERTYVYRILYFHNNNNYHDVAWGVPFEWDRSWRLMGGTPIDINAMQQAAEYLQGTHDFSTFQAAKCQRRSPIVTMKSIKIHGESYASPFDCWGGGGGLLGLGHEQQHQDGSPQLLTIKVVGESFLYHQVRNMVGCLVEVGRGKFKPVQVRDMIEAKNRAEAPEMAPAQGLFLVDVQHGSFQI